MLKNLLICGAVFGFIGNLVMGPSPKDPFTAALAVDVLILMIWYPVKAIAITCGTAARFHQEGRPLFEAGGLTEYDTEFARQVGEAAGKAARKND